MTLQKIKDELAELKSALSSLISNKATSEQVTPFQSRLTALEGTVSSQLALKDGEIKDLQAKLETAQGEVNAKGAEVKSLNSQLETEKKRTDETLAGMGIDPKAIPAPKGEPGKAAASGKILEEYGAITNSKERIAFYRKNQAAMDAAYGALREE
jgi:Tfp pilus assembly protein FimV